MATAVKRKLSGSTSGKQILVTGVNTGASVTVHTSVAGTTAGTFDEIWVYAQNNHTASADLTLEFGGTTSPNDLIVQTLPAKSGLYLCIPGLILQNSLVVKAFASVANVISVSGFVNSMTD